MTATFPVGIILLSLACYCRPHKLCSSYFAYSSLKRSHGDFNRIAEYKADTELTCALRCNTKGNCDEATFNRESKKCSLYQMKDKGVIGFHAGEDNSRSRTVRMRKVSNIFQVTTWQVLLNELNWQIFNFATTSYHKLNVLWHINPLGFKF